MQVYDLQNVDHITTFCLGDNRPITGYYAGDMLSWVMGHVKTEGIVFITMLSNMNVLAVASLLDCSAIIFREGIVPTNEMIIKAVSEGITLLGSPGDAFDIYEGIKAYETSI
ncbi:MAG: hypothetical protein WCQ80_04935 [Bacilli bacterium]